MKARLVCFACTLVLSLWAQGAVLAQNLPKYEIFELGYTESDQSSSVKYFSTVVDRGANTLWLCTLSVHHQVLPPVFSVDKNECESNATGPLPNLANMQAAQMTAPPEKLAYGYTALWLVDQVNGDVSLCFNDLRVWYNNTGVGCMPLTHPNP